MNIILDTHALIRALENNSTLSDKAVENIIDADNIVFVSALSYLRCIIKLICEIQQVWLRAN